MAYKLGDVTKYGCYKNGILKGNAKYCHNCTNQGGTEVIWTFEVLDTDDGDNVVGHIQAGLKCNSPAGKKDEGAQLRAIMELATSKLPT